MDSSQDEIGASAILSAQLDEELGGGPVQVNPIVPFFCLFCFHQLKFILSFASVKVLPSSSVLFYLDILSLFLISPMLLLSSLVSVLFCTFRLLALL